jgi:outer membrane protein assembly factor BamB
LLLLLLLADWPQFLGPSRSGVSAESVEPWKSPPRTLWTFEAGQGFAAPVIAQGKALVFHRIGAGERLTALDLRTGKTLWSAAAPTAYRDDFGFDEGPRAAPTVAANRVFVYGAEGVLRAHALATGRLLWTVDVMKTYAVEKGFFGAAGAPLFHDGRVLINAGGKQAGVVAFDAATGRELWRATSDQASYSSGVIATVNGAPAAVFFTRAGLIVLDPATGAVVHQMRWRSRSNASVNAATPVVDGNRIFLSASYGTGAILIDAATWKPVWSGDDSLSNHYATSVKVGDHLYGFHGRQETGQELRCVEWATGRVVWSHQGLGAGTLIAAGSRLLILAENGDLILAPASADGFRPLATARAVNGTVRAHAALSGGLLVIRNGTTLACISLAARG